MVRRSIVRRGLFVAVFALLVTSATASAQAPYVGASFFGDIVRTTHVEGPAERDAPGSGEAGGFALRVGTPIGASWGVDLEYARPSQIKSDAQLVYPLSASPLVQTAPTGLEELFGAIPTIYPPIYPIPLAIETRDRHSTLAAMLWALQNVSDRVALVYLGGVAFNRFERDYEYGFANVAAPAGSGLLQLPLITSRTIAYSARPVIGVESWIGLSNHIRLIPGVRLQTVENGWSVRPGIGIAWTF
jgi:hypothetical protein